MGRFNSLSLGQGLAKEDPFPCLSPPCFPALQLLHALWCSPLSPLPPPWSWAPVVPCVVGSHWSWCGARLDGCLSSTREQAAALALGGVRGSDLLSPSFQLLRELLVGGGPWSGTPGAGKGSVPSCPLQLELLGTEPPRREEAHTLPTRFKASFRDCCQIFVPPASPERGVLGAGRGGAESPHSLLPNRARKQHMVFLPLTGLESVVGQGAFSALQCLLAMRGYTS